MSNLRFMEVVSVREMDLFQKSWAGSVFEGSPRANLGVKMFERFGGPVAGAAQK